MAWRLAIALLLVTPVLAGCIGSDGEEIEEQSLAGTEALAGTQEALWDHPQTAPHPAFAYPTYTHLPSDAPGWWEPIPPREMPEQIDGIEIHANAGQGTPGAGIAIFGQLAIVPGWIVPGTEATDEVPPVRVFDISDPGAPELLSELELNVVARDTDTIAYPDGQLVVLFATDSGLIPVWDITDPTDPRELTVIQPPTASHNVAVVPGTPILYNANGQGSQTQAATPAYPGGVPQGKTEVYDLSDPGEPELLDEWENGYGCHDITFHIDASQDRHRAYCAGIDATQIWDVADPAKPSVVTTVPFPHGQAPAPTMGTFPASFSHLALVNQDATVLVVGDETGAGIAPYPSCDGSTQAGDRTVSGPLGNLYFYDITDETSPELVSWWSADPPYAENPPPEDGPIGVTSCTAHFGRIVPQADRDVVAVAFYGAGVHLVDFTDLDKPHSIAHYVSDETNVWDVWYYQGYLFTGDFNRGMDVLTLQGPGGG